MLYAQGTLRAENNALRQIAQKKINVAIESINQKIAKILDLLLKKLTPQIEQKFTIESLLKAVLTHPQLAMETATIERYSQAYPELQERVTAEQQRINTYARARLEQALFPIQTSRRFRFTKGLPRQ